MIGTGTSCRVRVAPGVVTSVAVMLLAFTAAPALCEETDQTSPDAVLKWNGQTIKAIQGTATDPFRASRALALESIAVLDTVRSIVSAPAFLVRLPGSHDLKTSIAVAAAAHAMLGRLFPSMHAALNEALNASLADEPAGPARERAVAFGKAIAEAVFAIRDHDGWTAAGAIPMGSNAGQWRPAPAAQLPPLDPQWATITPFALIKPAQFRPAAPPAAGTAVFKEAATLVASIGGASSAERTDAQTVIARYWSDVAGAVTPAGYWNGVAAKQLTSMVLGLEAEAELFAQLNVAMADVGIAIADAKYNYWFWRPVTAIHEGAAGLPPNPDWAPLLDTPNHPSYISGLSGFSGAGATVLTNRFGSGEFSNTRPDAPERVFASFQQAADEASASGLYGGLHYPFDIANGLAVGRSVGAWTLTVFRRTAEDRGPVIIMDHPAGPGQQVAQAPSGYALDNFSPVRTVTVRLDGGERFNVVVDDRGRFTLPKQRLEAIGFREVLLVATSGTGRAAMARVQTGGIAEGSTVTAGFTVK